MSKLSTYAVAVTKTVTYQAMVVVEAEHADDAHDIAKDMAAGLDGHALDNSKGSALWQKTCTEYGVSKVLGDTGLETK